jgi:GTP-binding protein LepA
VLLEVKLPLSELLAEFYNQVKSRSQGYASLDYEFAEYRPGRLVRLDLLVNNQRVDALSMIVHKEQAYYRGKALVQRLKEAIPRQLFEVPIQAASDNQIIARETIPALRKDVLAKLYGGDVTRKMKLLEKQRAGKKRMKMIGRIEIPQEAFLAVLKVEGK